jgi:hypothetical protein
LSFRDSSTSYIYLETLFYLPPDPLLRCLPSLTGVSVHLQHLILPLLPDPVLICAINVNVEALLLVLLPFLLKSLPRALTVLPNPILLLQVLQVVLVRLVVPDVHAVPAHWRSLVLRL